jgi:hypothetical protein
VASASPSCPAPPVSCPACIATKAPSLPLAPLCFWLHGRAAATFLVSTLYSEPAVLFCWAH